MFEIITTISVAAAISSIISLFSLLLQELRWRRSNRPIVSAYLYDVRKDREIGTSVSFNLVLINTGNIPAVDICIRAKESDIENIFSNDIKQVSKDIVMGIFNKKRNIPLLLNGDKTETFFGHAERIGLGIWKGLEYDAYLPVEITYMDLNKRKYKTEINIKVRDSYGFGGAVLEIKKQSS